MAVVASGERSQRARDQSNDVQHEHTTRLIARGNRYTHLHSSTVAPHHYNNMRRDILPRRQSPSECLTSCHEFRLCVHHPDQDISGLETESHRPASGGNEVWPYFG